jgi:capsular polysaccharide biosynthesis protein
MGAPESPQTKFSKPYLENQGFHTIYPESLPWADQVALFSYSGIEAIVSEYNSALHNAIFTPSGAKVIALNRLNNYQDHIASFAKHRIGYVCDLNCAPGAKSDPESRYVVDMSRLKRMLGQ